ncbi:MAG: amino acid adenylation domain-containing protein, partial [Psychrosphaera sp.]|nr:amino acid adenylation domain-containing protein [Psychrosphaera sp.]
SQGTRVGIFLDHSPQMMIAVLAVMKSGAAYVPLDPGYPQQRLSYMIEDAQLELVMLSSALMSEISLAGVDFLLLDDALDENWMDDYPDENHQSEQLLKTDTPVYLLYTSGSTGQPKGVEVTHGGLGNYLNHVVTHYLTETLTQSVVSSPLSFDATLTTLLGPLCCGGTVKLIGQDPSLEPLLASLESARPQLFKITPAHLEGLVQLIKSPLQSAHTIIVGGAAFACSLLAQCRQHMPRAIFVNEYGPTETVVGCCYYRLLPDDPLPASEAVPIGKPIVNTRLYVLGEHLALLPQGATGQLYIGGAGVSNGYAGKPELTAQQFITNPLLQNDSSLLYCSGDLVRCLSEDNGDGNLIFIGRADDQLNVRGYRIEPGEIESQLSLQDVVRSAFVCQSDKTGQILAYVTLIEENQGTEPSQLETVILNRMSQNLPEYLVPSSLIIV